MKAVYTTIDPHLASFLVSEGAVLTGLKRTGPKTVLFSFEASRELHMLLRLYWGGHPIPVVPAKLLRTLRDLKRRSITRRYSHFLHPLP
jgi:hypothetical protein